MRSDTVRDGSHVTALGLRRPPAMSRRLMREEREAVPDLGDGEEVAEVVKVMGNGMVEVRRLGGPAAAKEDEVEEEAKEAKTYMALLPARFRGVLFIRCGSSVVVRLQEPGDSGLVRSEVTRVLLPEHIKHLKKTGQWPVADDEGETAAAASAAGAGGAAAAGGIVEQDDLLFVNSNQRKYGAGAEDSESSSSSDDED